LTLQQHVDITNLIITLLIEIYAARLRSYKPKTFLHTMLFKELDDDDVVPPVIPEDTI
jgi:hypothetical protein